MKFVFETHLYMEKNLSKGAVQKNKKWVTYKITKKPWIKYKIKQHGQQIMNPRMP